MLLLLWIIVISSIVFPIVLTITTISQDNSKGTKGETIVTNILNNIEGNKKIINDIMINDNGKSRQIDHIFINNKGVFVIETKNYGGKIYGKSNSEKWTQYLRGKKYQFMNPIHQNYGHKHIVSKILEDEENVVSVVVFTTRCELKALIEKNDNVMYTTQLSNFINNQSIKLDDNQINNYYNIIENNKITNQEVINDHNYNVKHYSEYKENLPNENICPKCYGKLVLRTSEFGDFLGCSNYPKCRYIKKI